MPKTNISQNSSHGEYSKRRYAQRAISDSEAYSKAHKEGAKKLYMTVTTGRSGVKWLHEIFAAHKSVQGGSERNPIEEAFYRYIKFNDLSVDISGLLNLTKSDILSDWKRADISMIGSPYFSHDFLEIYSALQPDKVIWGINEPRFTVTSFYNKGWYLYEEEYANPLLACGLQRRHRKKWHHSFSRIVPGGEFYDEWKKLTRVGKISWFLNAVNTQIWSAVQQIPKKDIWIFRLAEANQNYAYYKKMSESFGLEPVLSKTHFLSLKKRASSADENIEHEWSEKEESEFALYASEYRKLYAGSELYNPKYMSAVLKDKS